MRRRRHRGYRSYSTYGGSSVWRRIKRILLTLLIVVPVISGVIYALFFYPVNINCGIVVDRKETNKEIRLKLSYGKDTKWVSINKNQDLPSADAYSVKLKGIKLVSIVPCKTYTGKLLLRSSDRVELDGKSLDTGEGLRYVKLESGKAVDVSPNKAVVGYSTYKFITDQSDKLSAVIVEAPEIDNVRVGISNAGFTSLNHSMLVFSSRSQKMQKSNYLPGKGLQIQTEGFQYKTKGGEPIQLLYDKKSNAITIVTGVLTPNTFEFTPKQTLGTAKGRIYITPLSDGPIMIPTLKRGGYYNPVYYGSFEVFLNDNSMRVVNEVGIEQYLRYVVPSEMSPYAKSEGYKSQTVAARTYVLSDMLSGRFAKSGFHVDDTIQSQVYNAQPSRPEIDNAIIATSGEVMTYGGKIIDAKYYSTSPGVGAPFNQVWYKGDDYRKDNSEPYLTYRNYTDQDIKDLSKENDASAFFKDWTIKGIDSDFKLFRWKVSISGKAVMDNINKEIYTRYKNDPESFKKKWYLNIYRKAEIPKDGIGSIQSISISERGKAGNVIEMTIVSDSGTYKILKEGNIKRLLLPKDEAIMLKSKFGGEESIKNYNFSLPSGFFVIDHEYSGGKIKAITLYGGGFGHGAGMSQNGVVALERLNKSYKDILFTYYENVKFDNFKDIMKNNL